MTKYFGLLLLFLVEPILAQQSTLNFKDAVKIALDNNISLKKQENQQYLSKSEKVNALVQVGPQLSAFGQAWRTQGNQFIEQEARVVNDAETDNFYGTVDADLTLFNGLKNYHTIKQTDYQFEAQNASVRRTEQTIISEVASKYLQCLLDKELLEIELANLEVQQKQLQQIENFVLVGSRPEIDVFTQNAKLKTQEVKVLRAKTKLRNDKMLLARTLQIELINDFNIADPFWNVEDAKIKFSNIHIDQLFNNGLLHRSDMQESILLEKAAKSEQSSSRSNYSPSLSLYGSINSRYSNASVTTFNDQFKGNLRKEYGLRLNVPIFTGFQNRIGFVRSKVSYENARLNKLDVENGAKSEIIQEYYNFQDRILNFDANAAQLEAATISFKMENERYKLGVTDLILFSQANQSYMMAQSDFAQAKYSLLFQQIIFDYVMGTLTPEDIP